MRLQTKARCLGCVRVRAHLWAYSSSTLLSPVTALASCFQSAPRSPTSIAWFISTTDDSISTATSSSGWDSEPCGDNEDKCLYYYSINWN